MTVIRSKFHKPMNTVVKVDDIVWLNYKQGYHEVKRFYQAGKGLSVVTVMLACDKQGFTLKGAKEWNCTVQFHRFEDLVVNKGDINNGRT